MLPNLQTEKETVTVKVKPIVKQKPDEIRAVLIDIADGRDNGSVNVVVSPQGREHQKTEELFSDGLKVVPNKMAEEASTGTLTEICEVITQTTTTNATMKGDLIVKSVPRQVMVEVLEETRTDENTIEEYTYDSLDKDEMTKRKVSTDHELLDMSQKWITQGFLELAEEAKLVGVVKTPSVPMNEALPEITEITRPTSDPISWKIEEDVEQSVESLGEVIMEVTTVRFDVGQLMRWPDMNSDGMMICEFMLESEMFSHGPARREAERVFVAAKSEMFTPVFVGGGGGGRC